MNKFFIDMLEFSGFYAYVNPSRFRYKSFWIGICDKYHGNKKKTRVKIGVFESDPHFFREIYPCSSSL